jgi:hypothetical protein
MLALLLEILKHFLNEKHAHLSLLLCLFDIPACIKSDNVLWNNYNIFIPFNNQTLLISINETILHLMSVAAKKGCKAGYLAAPCCVVIVLIKEIYDVH